LITPAQVEEWIREVQERPESAPAILREITKRLSELTEKNEALVSENIALRSGEKAADYERRIANLEYQLQLLKRQVGEPSLASPVILVETLDLLIYNSEGRILRLSLPADLSQQERPYAQFAERQKLAAGEVKLLAVSSQEELLFVFDSGRVETRPASEVPTADRENLAWEQGALQEPRGSERLATILPIGKMALYEFCIQASRRGYVKKFRESFLETCITNANVGSGVVSASDKTFEMALCNPDDLLTLVSKEGSLVCVPIGPLPYMIEEAMRVGPLDHVLAAFILGGRPEFLAVTRNGKAFHREIDWLLPEDPARGQKRTILSKRRLESGMRIVGAAAVDDSDCAALVDQGGAVWLTAVEDVLGSGSVTGSQREAEILSLCTFGLPDRGNDPA